MSTLATVAVFGNSCWIRRQSPKTAKKGDCRRIRPNRRL